MKKKNKAVTQRAVEVSGKQLAKSRPTSDGIVETSYTLEKVEQFLDTIAPPHLAEPWDKVGLLSSPRGPATITRVLVTLDLTPAVKAQCLEEGINLLVCYHPPIFKPLDRLCVRGDTPADLAVELAQEKIWIYSPHTALDVADGGTNDALAGELGLLPRGSLLLRRPSEPHLKLVIFVPESHVEQVATAVYGAGAGHIGRASRYTQCSFRTPGTGTFYGDESTSPVVGEKGNLEFVREIRFETVVPESCVHAVVEALGKSHPYEEPAFDFLVMRDQQGEPGMGRIADLPVGETPASLARRCKQKLNLKTLQVVGDASRRISTVGIVAGSCGLLPLQCGKNLDCVITGELKHHDRLAYQAAGVAAIILGHAESEMPVLQVLMEKITAAFPGLQVLPGNTEARPYV